MVMVDRLDISVGLAAGTRPRRFWSIVVRSTRDRSVALFPLRVGGGARKERRPFFLSATLTAALPQTASIRVEQREDRNEQDSDSVLPSGTSAMCYQRHPGHEQPFI